MADAQEKEHETETEAVEYDSVAYELCRAAQTWPEVEEDEELFADRLTEAVDGLEDTEFEAMSPEAQAWQEEAILAKKNGNPLPDLDGFDDLPAEDEEREAARVAKPDAEEVEKKTKARKAKAKGKKAAAKEKKAPAERRQREHGEGKIHHIMEAVYADPTGSIDSIIKKLETQNIDVTKTTVAQVRSSLRHAMDFLKRKGVIKD